MTKKKKQKTEFVVHPIEYPKPAEGCSHGSHTCGETECDAFDHGENVIIRILAYHRLTTCTKEIDQLLKLVITEGDDVRECIKTAALELLTAEYDYWRKVMDGASKLDEHLNYVEAKKRTTHEHICTECKIKLTSKSGVLYWCEGCSELYWEINGTIEGRRGLSYGN